MYLAVVAHGLPEAAYCCLVGHPDTGLTFLNFGREGDALDRQKAEGNGLLLASFAVPRVQ